MLPLFILLSRNEMKEKSIIRQLRDVTFRFSGDAFLGILSTVASDPHPPPL